MTTGEKLLMFGLMVSVTVLGALAIGDAWMPI